MSFAVVAGDKLRVTFICAEADQLGLNVVWMRCVSVGATSRNDDFVAHALDLLAEPKYKALLNNNAEYVGISVQNVLPTLRPSVQTYDSRGPGTAGAESIPKQVSGIITKVGAAGGRGRKGRAYIPFPAEDDNDADG